MKDVDSAARSRFIIVTLRTFAPTSIVGFFAGLYVSGNPTTALIVGVVTGIVFAVVANAIIEYTGSTGVNFFYGKRKPIYSEFEKLEGEFNQAQRQKSNREYLTALVLVNEILKKAPDLPQALFLKAQILWEGYRKAGEAQKVLEKLLEIIPDKQDTYHRWAQSLLDDINAE